MVTSSLHQRERYVLAASFLVPLALAASFVPLRATFASTAAALALVVVIFVAAVFGTRWAGFVASVSSALWLDYFLATPYDRFTINHRRDLETTIALVVVGVIITELAARSRHVARRSKEESSFISLLGETTAMASGTSRPLEIVNSCSASLKELLNLRGCRFETVVEGPPLARLLTNGEVAHVGLAWPVEAIGIPGPEAEILVQWRGLTLGRFVLTPTPGVAVSLERRVVAVALASVVAATLNESRRVA